MFALIRKVLRGLVLWLGPLVVLVAAVWLYLHGGRYATTENAYLKNEMVNVSSELSGRLVEVAVGDNHRVDKGQLLFRIDDRAYRIALARAEANLLKVRSNIESLRADYLNRQADVGKAEADLDYFRREQQRLQKLAAGDNVSKVDLDQAEYRAVQADKQLAIEKQALEVVKARLVSLDLPAEEHPDYLLALAERDRAALDLSHVEVRAPVSGIVANLDLQPGEMVAASVPLFTVVDDSHLWVEANFKETDLTWMHPGQSVEVEVDAYPELHWRGRVTSITPGTGSEFSLLPAQNSSGNWVKVVQRVAVKVELEAVDHDEELAAGMSAYVSVDTGHKRTLNGLFN